MENLGDFMYHHKRLWLILLILLFGGITSFFLFQEDLFKQEEIIGDALVEKEPEEPLVSEEVVKENTEQISLLNVDLKGAIKNPKVYQVPENTRIFELIEIGGGLTANAFTDNINLSKKISDEMVVYIFTKEEYQAKTSCKVANDQESEISEEIQKKESVIESEPKTSEQPGKISLNKATLEELMTLDGIGESKAKSIIEYRNTNNGFQNIEELKNVSGIGDALYEKVKNNITT